TFPDTATTQLGAADAGGTIESPLVAAPRARQRLDGLFGARLPGRLWLKRDDELPVSGSIKARGGFHEVLEFAEAVAAENGLDAEDPAAYSSAQFREIAAAHRIVVGSTGNLGLSIGILGAALGFAVTVHMSADAREWKKTMLTDHGVDGMEHTGASVATGEAGSASSDPTADSSAQSREIAAAHRIVVGSTGNLGLSIGILGAALGFAVTVHMSADAREWKKTMLTDHGVDVIEHTGDFVAAVEAGRA